MLSFEKTHAMPDPISAPSPESVNASVAAPPLTSSVPNSSLVPEHRHIWIVTGPAGCGKTTVAEYLSKSFSLPYLEGDSVSGTQYIKVSSAFLRA